MAIRPILSMLFLCVLLNTVSLKGINLKKVKEHMQIELVSYANGKKHISLLEKTQEPYYSPKQSTLCFTHPPKIMQSKFGTIFLYDLTKAGAYLNVLNYDIMKIDGNLSDISIGLADKYYYTKEDHFKLPLQHQFKLKNLFGKIDLCRLKYLVVLSTSHTTPPVTKITFKKYHSYKGNSINTFQAWAWNPLKITRETVERQPISRIYLQMKKGFKQALSHLSGKNIAIYGLNGSPDDIFNYSHLIKDIRILSKLKKKFPFIQGYQIDVEPYLLDTFSQNREKYLNQYLTMVKKLQKYTHQYGLKLSVVMPFWFDHLYIHDKNLGFLLLDIADEVTLMSYRSDLTKVVTLSHTLLRYANLAKKKVSIGIELMKIKDEKHTVYEIIHKKTTCLRPDTLLSDCLTLHKIRQYTLHGDEISFHGKTEKLKYLLSYPVGEKSFDGFVLHHFDLLKTLPPFSYTGR